MAPVALFSYKIGGGAPVPSFSYKIGGSCLIFQQNWRRRQGFATLLVAVLTWSGYWGVVTLIKHFHRKQSLPSLLWSQSI